MKVGDISVGNLQVIQQVLVNEGVDPKPLLETYGISSALLGTAYARISLSKYMRIGSEAIELTGKPWLGLLLGKNIHPGNMGITGLAAMTAPTLSAALSTTIRFESLGTKNIRGHSRYYLEDETGSPVCHLFSLSPYNRFNYFSVDTILSGWYSAAQWHVGQKDLLTRVEIEYPDLGQRDRFEEFFGCPVYFGSERNALIFSSGTGQLPCHYSNMANHKHALILCERELAALAGDSTFKDRVVEIIAPMLQGTPPGIEELAAHLGMASWTLRRKLKREETTFQQLLDQTRKELAQSYVSDSIHSTKEIAYILGFSSPAAFHRAFKRWLGVSPGQYRRSTHT